MKRMAHFSWVLAVATISLAACETQIISDGLDDDGAGGADDDGSGANGGNGGNGGAPTTSSAPPPPSPAISMLYHEYMDPPATTSVAVTTSGSGNFTTVGPTTGSGPTSSVSSGEPIDPSTLMVFLGSELQSCDSPGNSGCAAHWEVTLHIPPAMQQPGVYAMTGVGSHWESEGCDLGMGGGSYWEGTITITSVTPSTIDFTLSGTSDFFFVSGNADGSYSAPRCF